MYYKHKPTIAVKSIIFIIERHLVCQHVIYFIEHKTCMAMYYIIYDRLCVTNLNSLLVISVV